MHEVSLNFAREGRFQALAIANLGLQQQELLLSTTEPTIAIPALEPYSPQTLSSIGASQPLTKSNLRQLERSTPVSYTMAKRSRTETSAEAEKSKDGSSKSVKPDYRQVRIALKFNNFLMENERARKENPKMIERAMEVIDGKRGSAMGDDEQDLLIVTLRKAAMANEATFIDELWNNLLAKERMVLKQGISRENAPDDAWMSQLWRKDFLLHNRDRLFLTGCLPKVMTDDPVLADLLENVPRLTVPKPDLAYGIDEDAFTTEEAWINGRYPLFSEISPRLFHTFFVVEFKSEDGSIEDAKNQASRSAGALISGLRNLDNLTPGGNIKKGADSRTWVFSMAISMQTAQLYVNWANVEHDGSVVYHMHFLTEYSLKVGSRLGEFKKHVDNILDWGIGERKENIQKILNDVYANSKKELKRKPDTAPESGPASES